MSKFTPNILLSKQQDLFISAEHEQYRPFVKASGHAVFILSLIIFCYIAYSSFKYTKLPINLDEIRLVRKDLAPLKLLPDNPGGEQFSNQDKFIYSSLEAKSQKKEINKHLLTQGTGKPTPSIKASKTEDTPIKAEKQTSAGVTVNKTDAKKKLNTGNKTAPSSKHKVKSFNKETNASSEKQNSSGSLDSVFNVLN